jgi:hypothetical protein
MLAHDFTPMSRFFRRAWLLVPALAVLAACDNNNTANPTGPTTPTIPTVLSETFSGTLSRNSAFTHPFAVNDSGTVSVFLITSSDPKDPNNNAIPIGVSLGTWNGQSCAIVIANDSLVPGTATSNITGQATAAGNLCVRVYDVGFVPGSAAYEVLVDHP